MSANTFVRFLWFDRVDLYHCIYSMRWYICSVGSAFPHLSIPGLRYTTAGTLRYSLEDQRLPYRYRQRRWDIVRMVAWILRRCVSARTGLGDGGPWAHFVAFPTFCAVLDAPLAPPEREGFYLLRCAPARGIYSTCRLHGGLTLVSVDGAREQRNARHSAAYLLLPLLAFRFAGGLFWVTAATVLGSDHLFTRRVSRFFIYTACSFTRAFS